ncbi:MAG TPA: DoxX family membrane protein [Acidimicrobiales bacterium]|jgi:uncharacterized membrane protein YphA (DoxX/SURF4 family)|nr:DoxX family membrane protein [Acidimicrobiales bacterium]
MLSHRLARPLLSGMFISGGLDAVLHPDTKASRAAPVINPMARRLGLPEDTRLLVRANGAVQLGAGILLAMGVLPRVASAALAASLVPTTLGGHRFWEEEDPTLRAQQRVHFVKNAGLLGGLLLAATDTNGRPSMSWRAHRALEHAAEAVERASERAVQALPAPR